MTLLIDTIAQFDEYFDELTEDRRAHPTDDLATVIANGQVDGCPIDDDARLWYFIIVATAGHDTTSYALSGGMEALLRAPRPGRAARSATPRLVTNAVDEMIRWTSPVRHFLRYLTRPDTEVAGVQIPEGERLLLSYPSANRDAPCSSTHGVRRVPTQCRPADLVRRRRALLPGIDRSPGASSARSCRSCSSGVDTIELDGRARVGAGQLRRRGQAPARPLHPALTSGSTTSVAVAHRRAATGGRDVVDALDVEAHAGDAVVGVEPRTG